MTTITGSITNANPGPTLYALIETAALAIGWTLDDTVVIGGNTHKVLKSAAAGNTYGLDWYLDINYPTTGITGGIRFAPFEGYTAASDVGLRGPYGATASTTVDATTYSRFGATTSALETNWTNNATHTGVSTALTTSAFGYRISITRDRIIMELDNVPSSVAYTGFFTPISAHSTQAGAALFPLVMLVLASATSIAGSTNGGAPATAAVTRAPKAVGSATFDWQNSVNVPASSLQVLTGGRAGVAVSDFTNQVAVAPIPVIFGQGFNGLSTSTTGYAHVGYLDGLGVANTNSTSVRGDTLTVGSDTWYANTPSSSLGLFMKGV
jgi:hypothetical protein